jgi:hypothetical protein
VDVADRHGPALGLAAPARLDLDADAVAEPRQQRREEDLLAPERLGLSHRGMGG